MKNISILHRQFMVFLKRELQDSGLSPAEFLYLGTLYEQDGITQDELAREHCIDKAATARTLQHMERSGFVERRQDAEDRRAKQVWLTPKAYQYQHLQQEIQDKWQTAMHQQLPPVDAAVFHDVLLHMVSRAKDINDG